jgi:hypothetical protein
LITIFEKEHANNRCTMISWMQIFWIRSGHRIRIRSSALYSCVLLFLLRVSVDVTLPFIIKITTFQRKANSKVLSLLLLPNNSHEVY